MKRIGIINLLIMFLMLLSSCQKPDELLIVTTTSLDNSGLLSYLLPHFEEEYDCKVKVVAIGTGAALELGKLGEADILLVHDNEREMEFIDEGYGEKRKDIMYNDFVFVGPEVIELTEIESVLYFIKTDKEFYSRGDSSGTHSKEIALWEEFGYDVSSFESWYLETGQGMGATLTMTSLSQFYTFSDRSTFLAMQDELDLVIAYENKELLKNVYGVIKVNEELHDRDTTLADAFYDWITEEETQDIITSYRVYNEQLFFVAEED